MVRAKNAAGGIDGFTLSHFEKRLNDNLIELQHELISQTWNPEPYLRIEITKNETEKRKLGLLCIKDKIVQQAIKTAIEPQLEKTFLNLSYGYRPNKGPERAIKRVVHDLKKLKSGYVAKLDIDNYFDTINHERLFTRLANWLKDDETLRLIRLCIQTGIVTPQLQWQEINKGVPQGAILSPLLANFYLHPFDQFAANKVPMYIRYADDFLIATSTEKQIKEAVELVKEELESQFYLQLNTPIIHNFHDGIEFLGITISDTGLSITEKKKKTLQERINSIKFIKSSLSSQSKETLQGIKNYYAKLLPESTLKELDCFLMNRLNALIIRNQNSINNKKELVSNLQKIEFYSENSNKNKSQLIQQLCSTYIVHSTKSKTRLTSTHIDNTKLITQKKKEYQKRENEGAELVISIPGSYIGATYKGITVKLQGKIMWNKQVELPLEQKIKLATQIIIGKLKNQLNLIKYYHKYHKDILGGKLSEKYVEVVLKIDKLIEKAKNYSQRNEKYTAELMAIESQAAIAYWSYIRVLTADDGIDFIRREHQGATDLLNSLLNYGYAILYARVWKNILAAKLNPSIGVLHAKQDGKPTLVFDVVELFRAQMVDRVVISLIQKKVSLKMHDGLLNESSKRVLIRYILERLNRYEKYRGEEITFSQIILRQAQEIALFISGDNLIFKPYVAKW